jgi:hypothetical protein
MSEEQLPLRLTDPKEVDVDGMISKGVVFIGKALQQFDGTYRSLADVDGCLAIVELRIRFGP